MIAELTNRHTGEVFQTDPHQITAYNHLVVNPRAALFLEMSLSKTVIALTYLHDMHYKEVAFLRTLVIAPDKVARITWPEEINKWEHLDGMRYSVIAGTEKQRLKAMNADAEIHLISKDNLVWLINQYIKNHNGKWKGALPYDSILIDESSLFKNRTSQRFKALRRAIKTIDYRIIMTGTPATNGYVNLWAQILLLDDGKRLYDTFGKFCDEYFTTRGNGQIIYEYIPKVNAIKNINRAISDIVISMKTRDLIKMAPFYPHDEVLKLSDYDLEVYESLEREYVLEAVEGEVTVKTAADLTNKLLQLSGGAIYADGREKYLNLNTVKLDACEEILNTYNDNTILVYMYQHELTRIQKRFPHAVLLGKGKTGDINYQRWNRGEIKLMLIHPASAGHGLNLQFGGRRMIWYTPTHDLDLYEQTIKRLDRRGVDEAMNLHRLITEGTRDYSVYRKLDKKAKTQNIVMTEFNKLSTKWLKNI